MPKLEDLELQIKQTGAGVSRITKLTDALDKLAASAGKVSTSAKAIQSLGDSIKQASASGVAEGIKQTAEQMGKVSDGASEAAKTVNTFRQSVGKTTTHTHKFAKALLLTPVTAFANKVTGLLKPLGNLWRSFKRIAMYRALRTALKEITQGFATGIKNLYAWSGLVNNSFKGTMDSLATSMNYLRNSLGAMVSPLLDALAPAVDILVDKFVDLVNLVNQFFATMTGKTSWRKALKTQKEYADNTDKAAAAQAKLNHQLMAFDELNNISPNSPFGGRGGGSDDGVSSDDFEEIDLPDWAKDIKDAIDRGDWAGAGEKLATKLNNLINNWDAEGFGNKLGAKFEKALEFYNKFMDTTDWENIGTKLAGFVNGFLDEIDPEALGKALTKKIKAIVGVIKGFVWDVDLTKLGTALGTAFNEIFSEDFLKDLGETIGTGLNKIVDLIEAWADTVDFADAGKNLADGLLTALGTVDWTNVGETIGKVASGIATFLVSCIEEIVSNPEVILTSIRDLIGGLFGGLWGDDGEGMLNVVKLGGWVAGISLVFGGLKSTFSSTLGGALTSGAAEAFSATGTAATAVKGYMDTLAGKLGTVALVVGLTYVIATSKESVTPEKAAEKIAEDNPFYQIFKDSDTEAFKAGFLDALANDSDVRAAYEANLYQWGKDSVHQDQAAALEAARAAYESKFGVSGSGNNSGGGSWWEKLKDGLDKVKTSANNAGKAVKQLPPDETEVTNFKTQTDKMRDKLDGKKNSIKTSAAKAHTEGINKLAPTAEEGSTFWTKLKSNITTHLTGNKNSFVSQSTSAAQLGISKFNPTKAQGNSFWSSMKSNITTHLTGDKSSLVASATSAGTTSASKLNPTKAQGKSYWEAMKNNITAHLTGDKSSVLASATSAGSSSMAKLNPTKTQGNSFWTAMKNNITTHLTGDKNSVKSAATSANTSIGKIKPSDAQSKAFESKVKPWKTAVAAIGTAADTDKTKLNALTKDPYAIDITAENLAGIAKKIKDMKDDLSDTSGTTWKIKMEGDVQLKSKGGKFWLVPGLADGGYPAGDLFVANEAGPELVGTINGRTAVASNQEITGISDAVYNTGEAEAALLKEQNALLRQILARGMNVTLAPNVAAGKWVAQSQAAYARATGG